MFRYQTEMINSGVSENVFESFKDTFEGEVIQIIASDDTFYATKIEGGTLKSVKTRYRIGDREDEFGYILQWIISVSENTIVAPYFRATVYPNGMIGWDTQWDCRKEIFGPHWHNFNNRETAFKVFCPEYCTTKYHLKYSSYLFDYEGFRYTSWKYNSDNGTNDFILKQDIHSFANDDELDGRVLPNYKWEKFDQIKYNYMRKMIVINPIRKSFLEEFPEYKSTIETLQDVEEMLSYSTGRNSLVYSIENKDGEVQYFIKTVIDDDISWCVLNDENEDNILKNFIGELTEDLQQKEGELIVLSEQIGEARAKLSETYNKLLFNNKLSTKYYTT